MRRHTIQDRASTRRGLTAGIVASLGLSIAVVASSARDDSTLGAPALWPWLLTGLQVLALWAAGRRQWWAWLLGGSVQLPWIAYALMTDQIGFIPGCAVSASVQIYSFLRDSSRTTRLEAMA
ncbi:MAG TPA: hypothetical protein VK990_03945 [Acidimicrobiia bacterium]|nr:hypothetical protein [Acidimicrobiia bacterium]